MAFYGRSTELEELILEVVKNRTTLFGIEGVTGIGKTRFCKEFGELLHSKHQFHTIFLDAADYSTEDAFIAGFFSKIEALALIDPAVMASDAYGRATQTLPEVARELLGAVFQDAAKAATKKFEKTAEAIGKMVSLERKITNLEAELNRMSADNKRLFISNSMKILNELGHKFSIQIDNFQNAEPTTQKFIRHLIDRKPGDWIILIIYNTEISCQYWKETLEPLIPMKSGRVKTLQSLDTAIAAWYTGETGNAPSPEIVHKIQSLSQGGRAQIISSCIKALRDKEDLGRQPDFEHLIEQRRRSLSVDARRLGEILSVIKLDASVPESLLEMAAKKKGIKSFTDAVGELSANDIVFRQGGKIKFSHSSWQESWQKQITEAGKAEIAKIWFETLEENAWRTAPSSDFLAAVPIARPVIISSYSNKQVTDLSNKLIVIGAQEEVLEILEASWKHPIAGGDVMDGEHALMSARVQLGLGRYEKADEALQYADQATKAEPHLKNELLLLRMKLSLRTNAYSVVWQAAKLLTHESVDINIRIESELIRNTALRDFVQLANLKASVKSLNAYNTNIDNTLHSKIHRALARSYAKLGDTKNAIEHAGAAYKCAIADASIRDIGNAQLALAEAYRYAKELESSQKAYEEAEGLALGTSNRDSLLWAKLGLTCLFIEHAQPKRAKAILGELECLFKQPGYKHPLEEAHHLLLVGLITFLEKGLPDSLQGAIKPYSNLGITWPEGFISDLLASKRLTTSIPI